MQWIEIMGPHGIGKTTLLRGVHKFTKQPKHPIRRIHFRIPAARLNYNFPMTWGLPEHWSEFARTVDGLYRRSVDDHSPDPKRRRNFCGVALRMVAIEQADYDWLSYMDLLGSEGMRLSFVLQDPSEIRSYFMTMPISFGVVMLSADPRIITTRNEARSGPNFGVLVAKGVRACEIAVQVLTKRTRVLHLDATQRVEDNVRAIAKFAGFESHENPVL